MPSQPSKRRRTRTLSSTVHGPRSTTQATANVVNPVLSRPPTIRRGTWTSYIPIRNRSLTVSPNRPCASPSCRDGLLVSPPTLAFLVRIASTLTVIAERRTLFLEVARCDDRSRGSTRTCWLPNMTAKHGERRAPTHCQCELVTLGIDSKPSSAADRPLYGGCLAQTDDELNTRVRVQPTYMPARVTQS